MVDFRTFYGILSGDFRIFFAFFKIHFLECGRCRNVTLSLHDMGSSGSFEAVVGAQAPPPCVEQTHFEPAG